MNMTTVMIDKNGNSIDSSTLPELNSDENVEYLFTEFFNSWAEPMIGIYKCNRAMGKNVHDAYRETITSVASVHEKPEIKQ